MSDTAQEQKVVVQQNGTSDAVEAPHIVHTEPAPPCDSEDKKCVKTGRQMRQEGQRNLQDSTFSISEELDRSELKTSVRVRQPPGGASSGSFW